jgi:hypothetical protein
MYGVGQINLGLMAFFSSIIIMATQAIAVIATFWTTKRYVAYNPKPTFSMAWISLSSGLWLWFLSHILLTIYILFLHTNPFPSFADALYLIGYVPLFLFLLLILKMFETVFSKKTLLIQSCVSFALLAVVAYLMLMPIINSSKDLATTVLLAAYPILDIVLFHLALGILLVFMKGSMGKAWFFLTFGLVLGTIGDLLFTYAQLQNVYYAGHALELFWLWGYASFLLGLYIHRREV